MSVEEMLCIWAAGKLGVPRAEVLGVEFRHEDGWQDEDSGTYWPEENVAVAKMASAARGDPPKPREREIAIDGLEGLTGLIREIVGSWDGKKDGKGNA